MSSEYNQDKIVDKLLKNKTDGFFVDIGASYYQQWNNTYFFEKERNFRGIAVELNSQFAEPWKDARPNTIMYNEDATQIDYEKVFIDNDAPKMIDFLSIDIDPNTATWEVLQKIIKTKYTFGVIAFEVDYGSDLIYPERFSVRDPSRLLLIQKDYVLVKEIYTNGNDYHVDDIWVHKSLYNYEIEKSL